MFNYNINRGNLVKFYSLNREDNNTRVIDNNSILEEKLEKIRLEVPDVKQAKVIGKTPEAVEEGGFTDGLDVTMLETLTGDGYEETYDEEGNPIPASNVIKASVPDEMETMPEVEMPNVDEVMASAMEDIERMKQEALTDIENLKARGYEEGREQGYAEGIKNAEESMALKWSEIEEARACLSKEREEMLGELEPQFVSTITAIYEKIFEVDLRENKSLVVNLLRNTLLQTQGCQNYLIHVSREDREYVMGHKAELMTLSMPEDATVDVVEDITLKVGECMIETANGIYDCGLGTQLSNLRKKLELLSFTP